jgi:hypothetical protein
MLVSLVSPPLEPESSSRQRTSRYSSWTPSSATNSPNVGESSLFFPEAIVFHKAEDQQILKLDFPSSATSSPYVGESSLFFPGARVFHKAEDQQILKLDFPSSATSSPYVGEYL